MIERRTYTPNIEQERKLVYSPSFDERDYGNFKSLPGEEKKRLEAYTRRQLETYIGERVSVIKSPTRFEIVDGKMVAQGVTQSMEDMVRNGVEYRRKYGNPIDFEREKAELEGAIKTQGRLTHEQTQVGAKNLSVSLKGEKGSDYTNNFFDVYELKEDENGRYIELTRYLSTLNLEQYKERLRPFKEFGEDATAADFLREPIDADLFESSDDVQKYLSKGLKALEEEKLEIIKQITAPVITSYINSLIDNPYDFYTHRLKYNAVLNQADEALAGLANNDVKQIQKLRNWASFSSKEAIEERAMILGIQRVREAGGPCPGVSGGINLGGPEAVNNPFSVSQFGQKKEAQTKLCCKCPFCEEQVEAEIGGGRIRCPNCKESAPYSKPN